MTENHYEKCGSSVHVLFFRRKIPHHCNMQTTLVSEHYI